MTEPSPGIPRNRRLCPGCCEILPRETERCGSCGLDLAWLAGERGEIVDRWLTACTPELHVTARWAEGQVEGKRLGWGEVDLELPQGRFVFRWNAQNEPVCVTGPLWKTPQPIEDQVKVGEIRFTVRRTARLPVYWSPSDIQRFDDEGKCTPRLRPITKLGSRVSRDDPGRRILPNMDIAEDHCAILRQVLEPTVNDGKATEATKRNCYWICSQAGKATFVNRRAVIAQRLEGGDLLQIGPYAYLFDDANECLVPVRKISGQKAELRKATGRLFSDLDLSIEAGSMTAIVGKSGSGKSSLLNMLIDKPGSRKAGDFLVGGQDVDAQQAWFRRILGYVSQTEAVHKNLTPRQAIKFGLRLRRPEPILRRAALNKMAEEILDQVEFDEADRGKYLYQLSGGQRQRVRLACELVAQHVLGLLVLDEPTAGLERSLEHSVFRLLKSFKSARRHRGRRHP